MFKAIVKGQKTQAEANIGRYFSMVALLFTLCTGAFLAIFSASRPSLPPYAALSLFLTILIASTYLAQLFFELEGWFEQRKRDLDAQDVYKSLVSSDGISSEDFILYLRPFASTNKISQDVSNVVALQSVAFVGGMYLSQAAERVEFEEDIEKSLRPLGKLIALGKPLEHLGAGRIRVDDNVWQDAIRRLIDGAMLIVLLPSPRPGTCWEIEHILTSGAIRKTIIVDPPNEKGSADDGYDPEAEWAGVRQTFLEHGYVLPEDEEQGQLLVFGDGTQPILRSKIGLDGENKIRSVAKKLLKARQKQKLLS